MNNFLSTLIQREHGGFAAHAISPRLPSRYEPVERSGSVATLERTEPAGANWGTNGADARYTPPSAASDQNMRAGRGKNTPSPPAAMVPRKQEIANTNALSLSITLPLDEPVDEHEQVAARKDFSPIDPAAEPEAMEPARVEKRHVKATSRIDDTAGHEERSNAATMPKREYDGSSQHKPEARYKATEHTEDLPSANSHPPTYTEQAYPAKRRAVAAPKISNVIRQNGRDEHRNMPITVPEKLGNNPPPPTVATQVSAAAAAAATATATATAVPAPQPIAKREPTAIRKESPPADAGPAIDADTVEQVPTAKRTVVVAPHTSSTGTIAGQHRNDSSAPPLSREVFPVRVTVGKSGGVTSTSSSRLSPDTSSHREAGTSAPAPTINVTIGRIEVRAVAPTAPPKRPHAASKAMSLDQYLNRNSGQRNQQGRP